MDFVVIGSGPAGQKAAIQAAKIGKKVVVCEKWGLGGSSAITATVPSKCFREAVIDLTRFIHKSFYGTLSCKPEEVSIDDLNYRLSWVLEHQTENLRRQLDRNGIEFVVGEAKFLGPDSVGVYDRNGSMIKKFFTKKTLISVGSKPRDVPWCVYDGEKILNSTQLLKIQKIPQTMIVYGAGVIGCEYASIFSILGTKVILVDKRECPLPFLDREMGKILLEAMEANGLTFRSKTDIIKVESDDEEIKASLSDGSTLHADMFLFAAGRTANVGCLELENAGLELEPNGYIGVNENFETKVPGIFAAGDVIGGWCLSSVSFEQGRAAARSAFDLPSNKFPQIVPSGVYTIPEISSVGITEEQAKSAELDYEVGRAYYYEITRSLLTADETGLIKIIFNKKTLEILGVHIIGRGATEVIHIAQVAMTFNAPIDYFIEQLFNYPTFAEGYRIAAFNGMNKLARS